MSLFGSLKTISPKAAAWVPLNPSLQSNPKLWKILSSDNFLKTINDPTPEISFNISESKINHSKIMKELDKNKSYYKSAEEAFSKRQSMPPKINEYFP